MAKLSDLVQAGHAIVEDGMLRRVDPEHATGHIEIDMDIKSIEFLAFCDCKNMTGVTIPDSVKEIGDAAFMNCESLERIDIPDSVNKIGSYALADCEHMEYINIPKGAELGENVFVGTSTSDFERSHEATKIEELHLEAKAEKTHDKEELEGQMTIDDVFEKYGVKESEKEAVAEAEKDQDVEFEF